VCLPGLTRNARDFTVLAEALCQDDGVGPAMRVISLELRGRGRSGHADATTYTPAQELKDVIAALDEWGIERARFVGTSRGGILTMLLATVAPERIDRAVLNDIGPRIEPEGLARIAESVGAVMEFSSYAALAAALRERLGGQFPRLTAEHWDRLARQLASPGENGSVRFDYDAALAQTMRGVGRDGPAPDFWPAFDALSERPVLVLRGAHSDILSAATVEAMRRWHRHLGTLVVGGEGHAPLLWDRHSVETVKSFLCAA